MLKKIREYLFNQFAIDTRAITPFRVTLAVVLIFDLLMRIPEVGSFYADNGVLPRYIELSNPINYLRFSVHYIFGSISGQLIIFVVHILLAFLFAIGFRLRWVTPILWVFTSSLHVRNYLVLQSGDTALRLFIFWSMFLPIFGELSFDGISGKTKEIGKKIFTIGIFGMLSQVAIIYFFAGYEKSYETYFSKGDALLYAMNLERYATDFGISLQAFPELLKLMSRLTYAAEILCPILLFIPFKNWIFRTIMLVTFVLFHIGTVMMMEVGFFPFISMTMWVILLPSQFFDLLKNKKALVKYRYLINYSGNNFWKKTALILSYIVDAKLEFQPSQSTSYKIDDTNVSKEDFINEISRHSIFYSRLTAKVIRKLLTFIFSFDDLNIVSTLKLNIIGKKTWMLVGVLFVTYNILLNLKPYNFTSNSIKMFLDKIESIDVLKHGFNFEQRWGMFSPYPSKSDGWHVIYGERFNGSKVDLWGTDFRNPMKKPESVADTYRNQRWRKYLDTVIRESHKGYRPYFLQHICYEINKGKKNPMQKLKKVYHRYIEELTLEGGKGVAPLKEIDFGSVTCIK